MITTKAIIFDNGSVLEGPLLTFEGYLAELATQHGFETGHELWLYLYISEEWEDAKRGRISPDDFWRERLAGLGVTEYKGFREALFAHRAPNPAMTDLVHQLHGRYQLAILSNTAFVDLRPYLDQTICDRFDLIVSSAAEGLAKPESAIYELTLARLGIAPGEALFVDDLKRNTDAAEALGIPSVVFTTAEALIDALIARGLLG